MATTPTTKYTPMLDSGGIQIVWYGNPIFCKRCNQQTPKVWLFKTETGDYFPVCKTCWEILMLEIAGIKPEYLLQLLRDFLAIIGEFDSLPITIDTEERLDRLISATRKVLGKEE